MQTDMNMGLPNCSILFIEYDTQTCISVLGQAKLWSECFWCSTQKCPIIDVPIDYYYNRNVNTICFIAESITKTLVYCILKQIEHYCEINVEILNLNDAWWWILQILKSKSVTT